MDYKGMTVNERLWESGQWKDFHDAQERLDAISIIKIAKSVSLGRSWLVPFLLSLGIYTKELDYGYCMSDAERADVDGDYQKAIALYSADIEKGLADIDEYINLAYLLWRHDGQTDILNKCSQLYPYSSDAIFWKEYFYVSGNWKAHSEVEWLSMIEKFKRYYIPTAKLYFVCYLHCKEKYADKMDAFLTECDRCPTALNLYIKDMIEMTDIQDHKDEK